jgi:hypothetical protein
MIAHAGMYHPSDLRRQVDSTPPRKPRVWLAVQWSKCTAADQNKGASLEMSILARPGLNQQRDSRLTSRDLT